MGHVNMPTPTLTPTPMPTLTAPFTLKMWDVRGGQVSGTWYNEVDRSTRSISADPKVITLSSVSTNSEKRYPYTVVFEVGKKRTELTFTLIEEDMDELFRCTKAGKLQQAQALNQASILAAAYASITALVVMKSDKCTVSDKHKLMWREFERLMYGGARVDSKAKAPTKDELARGVMNGIRKLHMASSCPDDGFDCGLVREDQKWWFNSDVVK